MSSINKLVSTDLRIEQSKVIEEVVSLEVSKLNHSVMNKKKDCENKKVDSSLLSTSLKLAHI